MVEITEELEIKTNSEGWVEVKGSDVLLKVVEHKKPLSVKKEEAAEEELPLVKIDDTVLINLTARQADHINHIDGAIVQQGKSWVVGVGDLDVLPKAIELGLVYLRAGDIAHIYSTPIYAYGENSIRKYKPSMKDPEFTLPANSCVLFDVELLQIVADTSRLNPYFPIQKATTRKLIANDIYQNEWNSGGPARERAIRLYEKVVKDMKKLLDGTYFANVEVDHPQKKQCKALVIDSLNNVTAVCMSAKRYHKGKEYVYEVLEKHDPNNVKALIRYIKCCLYDEKEFTVQETSDAIKRGESIITYKHPNEEEELKKIKQQFKRKKLSLGISS